MKLMATAGVLAAFMAALFAAGKLLVTRRQGRVLYSVSGIVSLLALHALHTSVGVNAFTLLVSILLGVPGTALVWVVSALG